MDCYTFWDKIVDLHDDYEETGIEKYIIVDMSNGAELILTVSNISILESDKVLLGLLDDGTEILISIDDICSLRYNPEWVYDDLII